MLYVISAVAGGRRRLPHRGPDERRERDAGRLATSCRRWRPRSSAARRSWVGGAATAGTIVGALILTVTASLLSSLGYPEAVPPDPVRCDHRRRRGRLRPGHRRDLMAASGPPAGQPASRPRPGGHEPQVGDGRAGRRRVGDPRSRAGRHAAGGRPGGRAGGRGRPARRGGGRSDPELRAGDERRDRRARAVRPRGRHGAVPRQRPRSVGRPARSPARSAKRSACRRSSSTTRGRSGLPSCGSVPAVARPR